MKKKTEKTITVTIESPDGSISELTVPKSEQKKVKVLKKLETHYHRDKMGGSEKIHKITEDERT